MIAENMLALVGNTPLVRLNRVTDGAQAEVVVKLESRNPSGSVKDRAALFMLADAEARGLIGKDTILVEPTSGNTGIGLAFVCAVRGWKLVLTMPESMSLERRAMLSGMGATLELTPASEGMAGAVAQAERIVAETPGAVLVGQFVNPANPEAHRKTTAEEIWRDAERKVDAFVAGVGTGGTVIGTGARLKELNPMVRVYAVEPSESAVLSGGNPGMHGIQGIGAGFIPKVYEPGVVDGVIAVPTQEALIMARRLMREEGISCGISSGANVFAAVELARHSEMRGKRIVTIVCDSADRYISTELFPKN